MVRIAEGARVMRLERLPLRGGDWNNGSTAGVFALNLNNVRTIVSSNVGFRPALGNRPKAVSQGAPSSALPKGPSLPGQVPKNVNSADRDSNRQRRRPFDPRALFRQSS